MVIGQISSELITVLQNYIYMYLYLHLNVFISILIYNLIKLYICHIMFECFYAVHPLYISISMDMGPYHAQRASELLKVMTQGNDLLIFLCCSAAKLLLYTSLCNVTLVFQEMIAKSEIIDSEDAHKLLKILQSDFSIVHIHQY